MHCRTIFVVTNTNDSGAGSLRQAMLNANGLSGTADIIRFNGDPVLGPPGAGTNFFDALPT